MTELYIDGYLVTLPEKFSFNLIKENPFFNKNGEYTYDITLSLSDPANAKLYRHINRVNKTAEIRNRRAILVCDCRVALNGTEVVMENTHDEVKIQLVSGNSELNYFAGSDQKITELNLGEVDIDLDKGRRSLFANYNTFNYCCPPVFSSEKHANFWAPNPTADYGMLQAGEKLIPQPYLLYYIEKIPEALGYSIEYNLLRENEMWLRTYILNLVESPFYADFLPNWTVGEFFEEVEKLLGVIFSVDQRLKKISILQPFSFLSTEGTIHVENKGIFDEYTRSFEKEDELPFFTETQNIKYAFPSDEIYYYLAIPNEILKYATVLSYSTYDFLFSYSDSTSFKDKFVNTRTIFYAKDVETYYMVLKSHDTGNTTSIKSINIFQPIGSDEDAVELRITPARLEHQLEFMRPVLPGPAMIPLSSNSTPENDPLSTDFKDMILEGIPEKEHVQNIEIAIYVGVFSDIEMGEMEYLLHTDRFPISINDYMGACTYFYDTNKIVQRRRTKSIVNNWTLRLQGEHGLISTRANKMKLKTDEQYIFKFLSNEIYDVRKIFHIRNKEFLCKQQVYTVTENGLSEMVEGIFFEIESKD